MDNLYTLPQNRVPSLPPSSTKSWTETWISTYAFLLPTTFRLTELANEPSYYTSSTCASTAMRGKTATENDNLLQNWPTIPHLLRLMLTLPIESCMTCSYAQYNWSTTTDSAHLLQKNRNPDWLLCPTKSPMRTNASIWNAVPTISIKLPMPASMTRN